MFALNPRTFICKMFPGHAMTIPFEGTTGEVIVGLAPFNVYLNVAPTVKCKEKRKEKKRKG